MKKTAPRISDNAAEFYAANFRSLNAGLEYVADVFPTLYRTVITGVLNRFTSEELLLIRSAMNSTKLSPQIAGHYIELNVTASILGDNLDQKLGVDGQCLQSKIADLDKFELACLEIWAQAEGVGDQEDALITAGKKTAR